MGPLTLSDSAVESKSCPQPKFGLGSQATRSSLLWVCSNHVLSGSFIGQFRAPCSMVSEHGIQDGEQFSHHCDEGDFIRFAGRDETLEKSFER